MIGFTCFATVSYVAASYCFARNPQWLWAPTVQASQLMKQILSLRGKKILHISHRGGSFENFENTEIAFDHAVNDCNTDVIETDVCITKDGHILCLHDPNLKRLCGVDVESQDVNLSEIVYSQKIRTDFSADRVFETPEGQKVVPFTLDSMFAKYPNTHINLELKTKTDETLQKVQQLIEKHNRKSITQWGSFDENFSQKIMASDQSITRFISTKEYMKLMLAHAVGLLPFIPVSGHILQIPVYTSDFEKAGLARADSLMARTFARFRFLMLKGMNPIRKSFNEHLNRRGILVFYWVLNTTEDFEAAVISNPNGIITDTPTLLKSFLASKDLLLSVKEEQKKSD